MRKVEIAIGGTIDTLSEGETKTYTISGRSFEVTADFIGTLGTSAKFIINSELTDTLAKGAKYTLSDGSYIIVGEIFSQNFAGGRRKAEITFTTSAGTIKDYLEESESKTYTIGGKDYIVKYGDVIEFLIGS